MTSTPRKKLRDYHRTDFCNNKFAEFSEKYMVLNANNILFYEKCWIGVITNEDASIVWQSSRLPINEDFLSFIDKKNVIPKSSYGYTEHSTWYFKDENDLYGLNCGICQMKISFSPKRLQIFLDLFETEIQVTVENTVNALNNKIYCYSGTKTYAFSDRLEFQAYDNFAITFNPFYYFWCEAFDVNFKSYVKSNIIFNKYYDTALDYVVEMHIYNLDDPFKPDVNQLKIICEGLECTIKPFQIIDINETYSSILFHLNFFQPFTNSEYEIEWINKCSSFHNSYFLCKSIRKTYTCLERTKDGLLWPTTGIGKIAVPNNCSETPIKSTCEGNFTDGASWSSPTGTYTVCDKVTSQLHDLFVSNNTEETIEVLSNMSANFHKTVTLMQMQYSAMLVLNFARSLTLTTGNDSFYNVVDNIIRSDRAVLKESQSEMNSTDIVLDSLETFNLKQDVDVEINSEGYFVRKNRISSTHVGWMIFKNNTIKPISKQYNQGEILGEGPIVVAYFTGISQFNNSHTAIFSFFKDNSLFNDDNASSLPWVVSVSVPGFDEKLISPIRILLKRTNNTFKTLSCSHWYYGRDEEELNIQGFWKNDNTTSLQDGEYLICEYNHMTNFGMLLSDEVTDSFVLNFITIVGISLSITGALSVIASTLIFKKVKDKKNIIIILNFLSSIILLPLALFVSNVIDEGTSCKVADELCPQEFKYHPGGYCYIIISSTFKKQSCPYLNNIYIHRIYQEINQSTYLPVSRDSLTEPFVLRTQAQYGEIFKKTLSQKKSKGNCLYFNVDNGLIHPVDCNSKLNRICLYEIRSDCKVNSGFSYFTKPEICYSVTTTKMTSTSTKNPGGYHRTDFCNNKFAEFSEKYMVLNATNNTRECWIGVITNEDASIVWQSSKLPINEDFLGFINKTKVIPKSSYGYTTKDLKWNFKDKNDLYGLNCGICQMKINFSPQRLQIFLKLFKLLETKIEVTVENAVNAFNNRIYCYCGTKTYAFSYRLDNQAYDNFAVKIYRPFYYFWCEAFDVNFKSYVRSNIIFNKYYDTALDYVVEMHIYNLDDPFRPDVNQLKIICEKAGCTLNPFKIIDINDTYCSILFHLNFFQPFTNSENEIEWINKCSTFHTSYFKCKSIRKTYTCLEETKDGLVWPTTAIGKIAVPNNCSETPIKRSCEGNFTFGASWSAPTGTYTVCNKVTTQLHDLFVSNCTEETIEVLSNMLANFHKTVTLMQMQYSAMLVLNCARSLTSTAGNDSFYNVVDNMMRSDRSVLKESQSEMNSTDIVLDSLETFNLKQDVDVKINREGYFVRKNRINTTHVGWMVFKNNTIKPISEQYNQGEILGEGPIVVAYFTGISQFNNSHAAIFSFFKDNSLFNDDNASSLPWVVSVSVPGFDQKLILPIRILLKRTNNAFKTLSCSHWFYGRDEEEVNIQGFWKNDNTTSLQDGEYLVCEYNHMTNFGMLLSDEAKDSFVLNFITIVGISLSITGALSVIASTLIFKKVKDKKNIIIILNFLSSIILLPLALFVSNVIDEGTSCKVADGLVWPTTPIGKIAISKNCSETPIKRSCEGNFTYGASWSTPTGTYTVCDKVTTQLHDLFVSNCTEETIEVLSNMSANFHKTVTLMQMQYSAMLVLNCARSLTSTTGNDRFYNVVDNMMRSDRSVLKESQSEMNSTDIVLDSLETFNLKQDVDVKINSEGYFVRKNRISSTHVGWMVFKNNTIKPISEKYNQGEILGEGPIVVAYFTGISQFNNSHAAIFSFFKDNSLFNDDNASSLPWVVSVSVPGFDQKLILPIRILLKRTNNAFKTLSCSHWFYGRDEEEVNIQGFWKNDNTTSLQDGEYLVCEYNHMTNFGMLLSDEAKDSFVLNFITIVGISLSITGALSVIASTLIFKKVKDKKNFIIILNFLSSIILLPLALFVSNVIDEGTSCKVAAIDSDELCPQGYKYHPEEYCYIIISSTFKKQSCPYLNNIYIHRIYQEIKQSTYLPVSRDSLTEPFVLRTQEQYGEIFNTTLSQIKSKGNCLYFNVENGLIHPVDCNLKLNMICLYEIRSDCKVNFSFSYFTKPEVCYYQQYNPQLNNSVDGTALNKPLTYIKRSLGLVDVSTNKLSILNMETNTTETSTSTSSTTTEPSTTTEMTSTSTKNPEGYHRTDFCDNKFAEFSEKYMVLNATNNTRECWIGVITNEDASIVWQSSKLPINEDFLSFIDKTKVIPKSSYGYTKDLKWYFKDENDLYGLNCGICQMKISFSPQRLQIFLELFETEIQVTVENTANAFNNKIYCYSGTKTYAFSDRLEFQAYDNFAVTLNPFYYFWCEAFDVNFKSYVKSNIIFNKYYDTALDYVVEMHIYNLDDPFKPDVNQLKIICEKAGCTLNPFKIIDINDTYCSILFHLNFFQPFTNSENEIEWINKCSTFNTSYFKCKSIRKTYTCLEETKDGLVWPTTAIGKIAISKNCSETPIKRSCEGNFTFGASWSTPTGTYTVCDKVTNQLHDLFVSNNMEETIEVLSNMSANFHKTVTLMQMQYSAMLVLNFARSLTSTTGNDSFYNVVDNMMRSDRSVLKESQSEMNSTDIVLDSLETFNLKQDVDVEINSEVYFVRKNRISSTHVGWMVFKNNTLKPISEQNNQGEILGEGPIVVAYFTGISQFNNSHTAIFSFFKDNSLFNDDNASSLPWVVSVSVPGFDEKLISPIRILLKRTDNKFKTLSCSHWYYGRDEEELNIQGFWKNDNTTSLQDGEYLTCEYNHMTNFGMLLSDEAKDSFVLNFITIVGISLSITGALSVIASSLIFKNVRDKKNIVIILNFVSSIILLPLALFVSNVIDEGTSCKVAGMFLHYCLLTQSSWTVVLSYFQYRRYVQVFVNYKQNILRKSCLVGWLVPLLPVVLLASISVNSYHKNESNLCYLSGFNIKMFVVAPILVILTFNISIFIYIIYSIMHSVQTSNNFNKKSLVYSVIKLSYYLFSLFGLSWLFGLIFAFTGNIYLNYIFTLTTSLQGFVVCFHYVINIKQKQYKLNMSANTSRTNNKMKSNDTAVFKLKESG
ncbi:unnamed protein product [Brassicogethes aeneus]|uniref:G-protein coupled receptors family 2 profile 2 domain-containing protein n=1 Tax=Brassicogethes aeneus TaxID=1431903 RepID=A0A9P0AZI1_BRAAE|nr:unnamed protein product [Brassicogethes aeneus]